MGIMWGVLKREEGIHMQKPKRKEKCKPFWETQRFRIVRGWSTGRRGMRREGYEDRRRTR